MRIAVAGMTMDMIITAIRMDMPQMTMPSIRTRTQMGITMGIPTAPDVPAARTEIPGCGSPRNDLKEDMSVLGEKR
jgi:hypothetical protein